MRDAEEIRCVVLGGGGHGAVIIDILIASKAVVPIAVVDRDSALWGTTVLDVPVIGGDEKLADLAENGATSFVIGVGSTGKATPRQRLFKLALKAGLQAQTLCHPTAFVSKLAQLGQGAVVAAMAAVNTRATVGANVIINTGAIVEHDCVLGDHVHIATGAKLAGGVVVGDSAHIGAGAIVKEGIYIGADAIVGAGAVVIRDVAPKTTVVGVPAALLKKR
jgi:sugar O-acyltransferase (sialic acid O-acetyltransferase NeuD family)